MQDKHIDELDFDTEQGLILDEAYQLGYHKIKDGCLQEPLRKLNALITTEQLAIWNKALELVGKDDRDYSNDYTDHDSKIFLVASSTACNELRAELRSAIQQQIKELKK